MTIDNWYVAGAISVSVYYII